MTQLATEFRPAGEHIEIDLPGARALFTTRAGGCSEGAFASLNLGAATGDEPARVARNRAVLGEQVGIGLRFTRQVHGANVLRGQQRGAEALDADGQASAERGVALGALAADCLPIALAGEGAVAIVHAGWRGLAAGVVEAGVAALREQGARGILAAAIGPGAGGCCYAAGAEVHAALGSSGRDGEPLDLKAVARARLAAAGVDAVHDVGICTICAAPERFFSHRRDRGRTGRQAGIVWRT